MSEAGNRVETSHADETLHPFNNFELVESWPALGCIYVYSAR